MPAPFTCRPSSANLVPSRAGLLVTMGLVVSALVVTTAPGSGFDRSTVEVSTPLRLVATETQTAVPSRRKAFSFRVASFNVLGHSHTVKNGDRPGFASGPKRMGFAYRILERRDVNVVGFQELQPPQLDRFNRITGTSWSVYPGGRLENIAMHNSIAWKTHKWQRVEASYVNIPYFKGVPVKMPVVKLRHRKTGRVVYFANFHNPADANGPAQKWRDQARRKQIALANRIAKKGLPLVITGDMNEREKYFCAMVAKAPMRAANGGRNARNKPCNPPTPTAIDWIFGSRYIDFTGYARVTSRLVRKTTDHPFIFSRARVPAR